jgi:hypothetical protein
MFSKIYETEIGQILIIKVKDTNNPSIKVYFEPEGLGICHFGVEMPDNTDINLDKIDSLFDQFTKEVIVEKVKEVISGTEKEKRLKSCLMEIKEGGERKNQLEKEIEDLKNKLKLIVDNLTIPKKRKNSDGKVQALEMLRCGIGGNFSGSYYDEIIELVYEPLLLSIK